MNFEVDIAANTSPVVFFQFILSELRGVGGGGARKVSIDEKEKDARKVSVDEKEVTEEGHI